MKLRNFFVLFALLVSSAVRTANADEVFYGLTERNSFVEFKASTPGAYDRSLSITGLQTNESILALDFRPCKCGLLGIGSSSRAYNINSLTGAVSQVNGGSDPFIPALPGTEFGSDFNPINFQVTLVTPDDKHFRISGQFGDFGGSYPDISYAPGDPNFGANPTLADLAYGSNLDPAPLDTTLYGIDTQTDSLVRVGIETGQLTTIGILGADFSSVVGFDIASDGTERAYAVMTRVGETSQGLYAINLATGAASLLGTLSASEKIRDMAIALSGAASCASGNILTDEGIGSLKIPVLRVGGLLGDVSVDYNLQNGTAAAGSDFTSVSGTIEFAQGQNQKEIEIPILEDSAKEGDETFTIHLVNAANGIVLGRDADAVVTILDNEDSSNGVPPPGTDGVVVRLYAKKKIKLSSFRRSGVSVSVLCSQDCTVALAISGKNPKKISIGKGSKVIPANVKTKVKISPLKKIKTNGISSLSKLKALFSVSAKNSGGIESKATQSVKFIP